MNKDKQSQDWLNDAIRVVATHEPNTATDPEQAFEDLQAEIGDKTNSRYDEAVRRLKMKEAAN